MGKAVVSSNVSLKVSANIDLFGTGSNASSSGQVVYSIPANSYAIVSLYSATGFFHTSTNTYPLNSTTHAYGVYLGPGTTLRLSSGTPGAFAVVGTLFINSP